MKHGFNSTYPVIFGIGTAECIVAVIREEAGQIWCCSAYTFQLQPLEEEKKITKKKKNKPTYSTTLLFGLRERGEEEGREGEMSLFFKFLGFAGFWVRAVRDAETRERE